MLSLARALLKAPKLLILDEMSLGLAPRRVEQLLLVVTQLKGQGLAVPYVQERTKLVLGYADYVYGMKNGRLLLEGPPDEVTRLGALEQLYLAPPDGVGHRLPHS